MPRFILVPILIPIPVPILILISISMFKSILGPGLAVMPTFMPEIYSEILLLSETDYF